MVYLKIQIVLFYQDHSHLERTGLKLLTTPSPCISMTLLASFHSGFRTEDDHSILGKPFDWYTWVWMFALPLAFFLILVISDFAFHGKWKIWMMAEFIVRSMMSHTAPIMPQARNYNRIYTITWVWGCMVLATSYTGFSWFSGTPF